MRLKDNAETLRQLEAAAKQGDMQAAGELLTAYTPYWMAAAISIMGANGSGSSEDASDLVHDAMLKLIELWKKGEGPLSNTRSYVTAMMRNAHLNNRRSPRSQEQTLDTEVLAQSILSEDDLRLIETGTERALVQQALSTLTTDHRTVLLAIVGEGKKPAELVDQLDRSAPAISNLLSRAKAALRRALLIQALSQNRTRAGEMADTDERVDNEAVECRRNASKLPKQVHLFHAEHAVTDPGLAHVRECEYCKRNWRRFALIMTAFGLSPLIIVAGIDQASPAMAAGAEAMQTMTSAEPSTARSASGAIRSTSDAKEPGAPTKLPYAAQVLVNVTAGLIMLGGLVAGVLLFHAGWQREMPERAAINTIDPSGDQHRASEHETAEQPIAEEAENDQLDHGPLSHLLYPDES